MRQQEMIDSETFSIIQQVYKLMYNVNNFLIRWEKYKGNKEVLGKVECRGNDGDLLSQNSRESKNVRYHLGPIFEVAVEWKSFKKRHWYGMTKW